MQYRHGQNPMDVNAFKVVALASAHKIYGPKGVGCLYIRKGTKIEPRLFGGQERKDQARKTCGRGFGKAAELALLELDQEQNLAYLRDRLIKGIMERIPHVQLNGHPTKRVPGNVNVSIRYVEGESLLLNLDMKGIAASSGSACTSGSLDPSHVLLAMGLSHEIAHGSLRMTLGRDNTEEDIDYVLEVLPPIVERLRAMSPLFDPLEKRDDSTGEEICHYV